ncbi:MAG: hypothetical protein MUP22_01250, partial [Desulfobacterales bacterium]|nr:hypothetical protein [Desulfobacterales bacterium]
IKVYFHTSLTMVFQISDTKHMYKHSSILEFRQNTFSKQTIKGPGECNKNDHYPDKHSNQ